MIMVAYLIWGFAGALVAGLVAFALNKWMPGWSLARRVGFAVAAGTALPFGIVVFYFFSLGSISLWSSPDEFLIPFTLQCLLIIVLSAPTAWLISRRVAKPDVTDVFD